MYKAYVLSLLIGIAIPHVDLMKSPKLNRVSHIVAKYSYGIYLSHAVVFWLAIYAMHDFHLWQRICVLVVGSILAPIVMFHAIEHPFISLGSQISARVRSTIESTSMTRQSLNPITR
jgi:peptidoglycan/LPS O-acetylase OafA/YrhL